ncbi:MAG: NUDIX hydrolase [Ferruginibacter sp.]
MQLKIYVDETPIYITDKLGEELEAISLNKGTVLIKDEAQIKADIIIEAIKKDKKAVILLFENPTSARKTLFQQFTIVEAAGGIVQHENKELLFIYRREKWDLPKGKMEENETPEVCAEREIEEETGVKNLTLKHKIGETYHIYEERGMRILKISHWFYFTSSQKQITVPQVEEDIAEVKWMATCNINEPMKNTYQNIKDILRVFFDTP